jgi:citrate lyase subunit beta / citryl-CoA lyase
MTAEPLAATIAPLFVPGDRPDRFQSALNSTADAIIIDWEDAVSPPSKAIARSNTVAFLSESREKPIIVRINSGGTESYEADLQSLTEALPGNMPGLTAIMVAKCESSKVLRQLSRLFPGIGLIPLIESARGIQNSAKLAKQAGILRLAFGALDFSTELSCDVDSGTVRFAAAVLVITSTAAGLPSPWDSPNVMVEDDQNVYSAAAESRSMGFGGKLCIHPRQISSTMRAFLPDEAQILWARRVLAVSGGQLARIDGQMIDEPVIVRAKKVLQLAGELPNG